MADDLQSKAADLMKKVLTVGIGTYFLTEESLKALVSDFKLPKELLSAVLESANKSKGEFVRSLSREVMDRVMDRVDPLSLIQEILAKNEIELQIKVNLTPKNKTSGSGSGSSSGSGSGTGSGTGSGSGAAPSSGLADEPGVKTDPRS